MNLITAAVVYTNMSVLHSYGKSALFNRHSNLNSVWGNTKFNFPMHKHTPMLPSCCVLVRIYVHILLHSGKLATYIHETVSTSCTWPNSRRGGRKRRRAGLILVMTFVPWRTFPILGAEERQQLLCIKCTKVLNPQVTVAVCQKKT